MRTTMNISKYRTAIMGLAALWVWYFHCGTTFIQSGGILEKVEWYLQRIGFCGVDIFILLSGFGLYYYFEKHPLNNVQSLFQYYRRRLGRIYATFLPFTILFAYVKQWTFREFIGRVTTYSLFKIIIYEYLWFMACLFFFYFIAPYYMMIFRKIKHKLLLTLSAILISILSVYLLTNHLRMDLFGIIIRFPVFLLGFYFGYLEYNQKWKRTFTLILFAALMILAVPLSYIYNKGEGTIAFIIPEQHTLFNAILAPGIIIFAATLLSWLDSKKVGKTIMNVLGFYGMISLEFYLFQEWIESYFIADIFSSHPFLFDVVSFAVSTILAYLLYIIFTKYIKAKFTIGKINNIS